MEREACVCDHGYERSDLCAEIIIIIIITSKSSERWDVSSNPGNWDFSSQKKKKKSPTSGERLIR